MKYQLQILPSGHRTQIDDQCGLVEALEQQGFVTPHSCLAASCGVCRARLVSGQVSYDNDQVLHALSDEEMAAHYILPCVARAQSDLVLEWPDVLAPGERAVQRLSLAVLGVEALNADAGAGDAGVADTFRVRMQLPPSTRPRFDAGQYLLLVMPDGSERAFSIASAPESSELELHIRAVPGHQSALDVVEHFRRRSIVTVKLPLGRARLPENDQPLLLIAGGTGLSPMKSVIESLMARGVSRPVYLYWGVAEAQQLYLHEQLQAWVTAHDWLHYTPVLAGTHADWTGARGFPHEHALADHAGGLTQMAIFVSGSEPMARVVYAALKALQISDENIYCDWVDLLKAQNRL